MEVEEPSCAFSHCSYYRAPIWASLRKQYRRPNLSGRWTGTLLYPLWRSLVTIANRIGICCKTCMPWSHAQYPWDGVLLLWARKQECLETGLVGNQDGWSRGRAARDKVIKLNFTFKLQNKRRPENLALHNPVKCQKEEAPCQEHVWKAEAAVPGSKHGMYSWR